MTALRRYEDLTKAERDALKRCIIIDRERRKRDEQHEGPRVPVHAPYREPAAPEETKR